MRKNDAFTIVEIIITITVIAILSSIAIITFGSVREDSRNSARQGNATIISEGLEKYYEQNGEYPSVASIANNQASNTGEAVAAKLSIPVSSLVMPMMPSTTTNGIAAGSEPQNDYVAYEASSAKDNISCQNDVNGGCDTFKLRYLEEGTGEVREIASRHAWRSTDSTPELVVTATGPSSINAVWTEMPGASSYTLQRSLSADMSSPITTTHASTSTTATGLVADTEYFFSVRATTPNGLTDWSGVESATTSGLTAPTGTIAITAEMSGTNARGAASGGACSGGSTIEYQIRYRINGETWTGWTTGTPRDVAATEGYMYTFQAQARCKIGTLGGPWALSTTASVTRSVNEPSGLTITAAMSGTNARGTAGGGNDCGAGTTVERQIRYSGTSTTTDSYVAYTTGTPRDVAANQGWRYTFQQRARCVGANTSSGWATSATAAVVRPITTVPAVPVVGSAISGDNVRFSWGAATCPVGTSAQYNGTETANHSPTSSTWGPSSDTLRDRYSYDGHTYTMRVQARCIGTHATGNYSGWSNIASRLRPVAPPVGNPSNFSHTYYSSSNSSTLSCYGTSPGSRLCRMFRWTQPTCRANAVPAYNWNSYMANFAWAGTGSAGWRYSPSTAWSDYLEYDEQGWFWSPSANPYPSSGMNAIIRLRYLCSNRATGQMSGYGTTVQSPGFN